MTPTEKGAFCQKCAHEVHDVTQKSNQEIRDLFRTNKGKRTCLRMTTQQEKSMNQDYALIVESGKKQMQRAMLFSLLVVFGFTLFSCNSPEQVKEMKALQTMAKSIVISEGKTANDLNEEDTLCAEKTEIVTEVNPIEPKLEEELIMLGEPVIREKGIDEVEVDIKQGIYHTMGIPVHWDEVEEIEKTHVVTPIESIEKERGDIPMEFEALTFPNPATTETRLEVKIPESTENLQIRLLGMNGRVLQMINESSSDAGIFNFTVPLQKLNPAYYLIDVRYNDKHKVVRLSKV